MSDSDGTNYYDDDDNKAAVFSGAVLVAAVVFFFITVFFVVFMYIYSRWRWGPESLGRGVADHNHIENTTANRTRGLDPKVRKSLPVIVFESKDFEGGLECAVCLSEVVDGEKARLLPNCKHGFHLDCIDMWFRSHSTCPLCRNPAGTQLELGSDSAPEAISADGSSPESIGLPTNVLFWGTGAGRVQETNTCPATTTFSSSTPSSSSSDGKLVIEIPRRVMEGFSSTTDGANSKTPTPTSTRLRSFRRLFSRGKRVDLGCSSPGTVAFDVEQGRTDAGAITTPKTTSD